MTEELRNPVERRAAGPQSGGDGGRSAANAPRARSRHPSQGRGGHPAGCGCTRCVGFTPGPNGTAVTRTTHGSFSLVEIRGRAAEVAEGLQFRLAEEQLWRETFRPAVEACALVLVRLERAHRALDEYEASEGALAASDRHAKLVHDAARWANAARGYLADLGLTPRALAAIARDTGLARSTRTAAALEQLTEHVERTHA